MKSLLLKTIIISGYVYLFWTHPRFGQEAGAQGNILLPMFSETKATRHHCLVHKSLPGSFCQSDLVLEASWGTWCSGGSRHSRRPSLHSLPLTSWCWWKTSLNLPSQWANLTSLGQGFKLLRSLFYRTENWKLLMWSLGSWGFCQSQVTLATATVTVSQVKT